MAAVAPSTDQAAEFLQKLSLDAQPKALEIPEPTKKPNANQYGSVASNAVPSLMRIYPKSVGLSAGFLSYGSAEGPSYDMRRSCSPKRCWRTSFYIRA